MADESVGDMEVMSEHTAVMETEVDQSDAPTPVLGDGGDKKEEKKEKSGEEDSGEGSSSAKNYPDDKEIVLINPTFGDLPTNLSSVKSVSVCANRNGRFRRTMEDSHVVIERFGDDKDSAYFAIYDGHGGRAAVEYVAKTLHNNFKAELDKGATPAEAFATSYVKTDDELGAANIMYSGTTVVTCYIRKENGVRRLYAANCGDARAVLCRENNEVVRLTYDHKANDEKEAERIRSLGGFVVMNRVNGILAVARSLGDRTMKEYVSGEPYTYDCDLKDSDTHLIVACDGIWDIISDEDACKIVASEPSAKKKAEKLTGHALKGGSTDNISVIVVEL